MKTTGLAIDRMTAEERANFVRGLVAAAIASALEERDEVMGVLQNRGKCDRRRDNAAYRV